MKRLTNINKKRIFRILLVALAAGMFACTERIEIELDESYTRLVVEGMISSDTTPDFVRLTTTAPYFSNKPPDPVIDALVTVIAGEDTISFYENEPGVYFPSVPINSIPGQLYQLKILLKDEIGGFSEYHAEDFMKAVNTVDSIQAVFHEEWGRDGIWEIKSYVQEPPGLDYYRFMLQKNTVMVTDSLDEWFITDDKFIDGNYSNGAGVGFLNQSNPSEALAAGDTVWLRVDNISPKFTFFIWAAQAELSGSNPMFSGPPANIKGNISNGAIGFFAAYSSTYSFDIIQ